MGRLTIIFLLLSVLLLIPAALTAQDQETRETISGTGMLPKGVSIYKLDNGLEVLLIENTGLPMTGVNVIVKTGSAYETFSTSGMSHMLEHLLFNGTETRSQKELYDTVDLIGGYNNANTGEYYTNYMMVTPAENIKKGMEIQADMLFYSIIPEEKFQKEKGIVLEEIARSLENENAQMERNVKAILYSGHALSLPTLGTYSTIEAMKRDDVYKYYKNTYVPNNMIMSVVGNFKTTGMLKHINEIYGKVQPRQTQYPYNQRWVMGFDPYREGAGSKPDIYHRFYKGENRILQLFYTLPPNWSDTHFILVDEILTKETDNISAKLKGQYPELENSLSLETVRSPGKNYLKVSATVKNKTRIEDEIVSLDKAVKQIRFQLPAESVQFLAAKTKTFFLKNVEKPHMFGIYNAGTFAVGGIEAVLASYGTRGYAATADEIKNFTIAGQPTVILQHPGEMSDLTESLEVQTAQIRSDLPSGITLIAEQNPASDLLAIHFLFKHKAQYESKYGKDAAKLLHDCFGEHLNSTENQKKSNKYGLTFKVNDNPFIPMDNIYLHPDFSYIRIEALADDLEGVVEYITGQLFNYTPSDQDFQKVTAKAKRPVRSMGSSKGSKLFEKTYSSIIYKDSKYEKNTTPITYDQLLKFREVYFHPSNIIVSVVSAAPNDKIFKLFDLTAEPVRDNEGIDQTPYIKYFKQVQAPIQKELDEQGERSYLFWGFTVAIDENDKPALKALDLLLSDHIIFDIREKQGRAYRMRAGINLIEDKALFYVNLGTRPENIDPLLPQLPGFFDQDIVNGFKEFDLEKSLNMYLGRMKFRRLSSINKAYYYANSQYFHSDLNYDNEFLQKLQAVQLEDVKKAAGKYMKINNPVIVIVR